VRGRWLDGRMVKEIFEKRKGGEKRLINYYYYYSKYVFLYEMMCVGKREIEEKRYFLIDHDLFVFCFCEIL